MQRFRDENREFDMEWADILDKRLNIEAAGVFRVFNIWALAATLLNVGVYFTGTISMGLATSAILVLVYKGFSMSIDQHFHSTNRLDHKVIYAAHSRNFLFAIYRLLEADSERKQEAE